MSTNDTAMALLPLLERPPWVRRGRGGALERFVGGAWKAVEPAERHRLGQQDGQVRASVRVVRRVEMYPIAATFSKATQPAPQHRPRPSLLLSWPELCACASNPSGVAAAV